MEVRALKSFCTIDKSPIVGDIFVIEDEKLAADLVAVGYVEENMSPADKAAADKAAADKAKKAKANETK